eukprot:TRINITY_DN19697_c0_g1_i1.p1 TRINITY_DN19697_c0_g1~~TRINITY_DN19697_c0_g1_i1.p1  ORF type:complete len:331 (-),score=46.25 TRINITY_DN19697_c0_g1_i1:93-1085(-)
MCYGCLILIVAVLTVFCVSVALDVERSNSLARECNVAGRQLYEVPRLMYFAREYVLFNSSLSLRNGFLTAVNDTSILLCHLMTTTQLLLVAEYNLLYGTQVGWVDMPAARGWTSPYVAPPSCSPLTLDAAVLARSRQTSSTKVMTPELSRFYFQPTCWTEPLFAASVLAANPRLQVLTSSFDVSKCSFFYQRDYAMQLGFHSFLIQFSERVFSLASLPSDSPLLHPRNPDFLYLMRYFRGSEELNLGLRLVGLLRGYAALVTVNATLPLLIGLDLCLIVLIAFQHRILGTKAPEMLEHNISMEMIVMRLIRHSEHCEKQRRAHHRQQQNI